MGIRWVVLLTLGWEDLPKAVSVHGTPPSQRLREPVPGVLVQTDGEWLLIDTGFNTALIRDPALYRRYYPNVEYVPILPGSGEPVAEALDEVGVDIGDIHAVAVSHLYHDHAGGLKLFAGRVPVHAQRREVDYGLSNPRTSSTNCRSPGSSMSIRPRRWNPSGGSSVSRANAGSPWFRAMTRWCGPTSPPSSATVSRRSKTKKEGQCCEFTEFADLVRGGSRDRRVLVALG